MRGCGDRTDGWRCALFLALLLIPTQAWSDTGKDKADRLCERADSAEREARDYERKSAERRRFLKGTGKLDLPGSAAPAVGVNTAALRQSIKAQVAQARAMLPQLRQGAAAASQDRGAVPGLSQYFSRMEGSIGTALQGIEACLDSPERCNPPSFFCPSPPNITSYAGKGSSADFVRQVQESYRKAANSANQACRDLQGEAARAVERLRQEHRAAGMNPESPGSGGSQRFGDADLYIRRSESLKRDAASHRLEADKASGVGGYCGTRSSSASHAGRTRNLVEGLKAAGKGGRTPGEGFRYDAKVIDLKAEWEKKWNKGNRLEASVVPPLPKLSAGRQDGGTAAEKVKEQVLAQGLGLIDPLGVAAHVQDYFDDYIDRGGPDWWCNLKSSYREADERMGLTEFIKDRPKELVKDVITGYVEKNCPYGKSLTTGYKILSAVKTTADDVGGIIVDAPRVIAYGSEAEAKALSRSADLVPVYFLNNLFDDVTGKFPMPKLRQAGHAHE